MNTKIVRIGILTLITIIVLSVTGIAFAEEIDTPESPVNPEEYQYAQSVYATCSVSGGTATAGVSVTGKSGVIRIEATYRLQKKSGSSWSNVTGAIWSAHADGRILSASHPKSV